MVFAALAQPFIPETSAKITRAFAEDERIPDWPIAVTDTLKPGAAVQVPDVLFAKIEDFQVAEWAQRFGGVENKQV